MNKPQPEPPAFRHDPARATVSVRPGDEVDWAVEPAVVGHRRLTAANRRDGGEVAVPVSATPAVVGGVGAVVASDDGRVRLLDQSLTRVYWERRLDHGVYASLVVDRARRRVVVASTAGLVVCLSLRGELVWSRVLGRPVFATPAPCERRDLLVVATFDSHCHGLRLSDGEPVFDVEVPRPWSAAHAGVAAGRDVYASPVVTGRDTVVVCAGEHVLALDADGRERWRRDLGVGVKASPVAVAAADAVAVAALDGGVTLLSEADGRPLAGRRLGGRIAASPALSGGVLAVGTQDGRGFGLDAATLDVRWRLPHGAPRSYTSYSVLPSGDFVATVAAGDVLCLGREDGAFRWQSSQVLGLPDHEPALDITPIAGPDGLMYCASYGGDVYAFRFRPTGRPTRAAAPARRPEETVSAP